MTDRADGYEFLWSGDPAVWSGRVAPALPDRGQAQGRPLHPRGQTYSLPKHGFARREVFRCAKQDASSLTFVLDDWEKHAADYPFRWALRVTFSLEGRRIRVPARGGEPGRGRAALLLPRRASGHRLRGTGELRFPEVETTDAWAFGADGLVADEKTPFLHAEARYNLLPHTFDRDAYILEGLRSPYVDVHSAASPHWTRVHFGGAPYVGIWAKPGAPYVCIEPWEGLDDDIHTTGVLTEKKGIVALPAGQAHAFSIALDFH